MTFLRRIRLSLMRILVDSLVVVGFVRVGVGILEVAQRVGEVALSEGGATLRDHPRKNVTGRSASLAHRMDPVPSLLAADPPGLPLDELDEVPHLVL